VTINLLSRAPPCFGRHVKPLAPAAFTVVSTHQSALGTRGGLWPVLLICAPGDINRLIMMTVISYLSTSHESENKSFGLHCLVRKPMRASAMNVPQYIQCHRRTLRDLVDFLNCYFATSKTAVFATFGKKSWKSNHGSIERVLDQ
jgi:hypothetical protein